MQSFRRTAAGIEGRFTAVEMDALTSLAGELADLLDESGGDRSDPVVARLFPDAFRDDAEAAAEFAHLVHGDVRDLKLEHARALRQSLNAAGNEGRVVLSEEQAEWWLSALNDLRLALGTRLDVQEDTDPAAVPEEDPRRAGLEFYGWLTFVQDSLVEALAGD